MGKTKNGRQTPTRLVVISTKNSDYKDAVFLYEKTGRKSQKWQEILLKIIFARTKKGLWVHTKFGYAVPRRNGKNEVVAIRELWGLMHGEAIMHTAHRTSTTRVAYDRLCGLLDLAGIKYKAIAATGRELITIEDTGGTIRFRIRSSHGGLGEGVDLLVIDEAQEYTTEQETALKYIVTSSKNPQTIYCGTPPTAVSRGTLFNSLRAKALEGGSKNTGWAEWSVDEEADPYDRAKWYETNPSLGTVITERSIEDEIGKDVIDFNIQRLGLWVKYNQRSVISARDWEAVQVKETPDLTGGLFVGVKFGADGKNVCAGIATKTTDGRIFLEVLSCRSTASGIGWLVDFLAKVKDKVSGLVIDGAGGQSTLIDELKNAKIAFKVKPILPKVVQVIKANFLFEQALFKKEICHAGQPSLVQVATNCEKRLIGSNGGFGYRAQFEDHEIALLDSVILAHWACREAKPIQIQRIGY
ncbi:terminase TerL endonuclease subunit [Mageeibacillus indolicus]|uniref:terminase TerL endonuclease subunit n=1 Tax=Mageeibacillus indolicus TaxID=884684 RepID=UPI0004DD7317|nr:terminase TerL endonuclease subunit [Mageeibacillus indolicus]KFA57799.1 terminase [Mageeibacillus indolicus 0009-5]